MKVNLKSKDQKKGIQYNNSSFIIRGDKDINFTIQEEMDVIIKKINKSQKLKNMIQRTLVLMPSTSILLAEKSLAMSSQNELVSQDLLKIIIDIEELVMYLGVRIPVILAIIVILYGMIIRKKKQEAKNWLMDIIKGYGQVLIIPIVLTAIFLFVNYLFQDYGWFTNPYPAIQQK